MDAMLAPRKPGSRPDLPGPDEPSGWLQRLRSPGRARSPSRRGQRLLAIALLLPLGSCAANAQRERALLFAYTGAGCGTLKGLDRFERFAGRKLDGVVKFLEYRSWKGFHGALMASRKCWPDHSYKMVFSVPMVVENGSIAAGARGDYDAHFQRMADYLVRAGRGDAYLRIGWEFNGAWYKWTARHDPELWVAYFRRMVAIFRKTEGARFRIVWNPALGVHAIAPDKAWPGDDVVDVIGVDMYNRRNPVITDPELRWLTYVSRPYGLDWLARFAAEHKKPIAIPEWGTGTTKDGDGAGDDPVFVRRLAQWIAANDVEFHAYWDASIPLYRAKISTGAYPAAGKAFQEVFGPDAPPR